jgi:hypothetical protein
MGVVPRRSISSLSEEGLKGLLGGSRGGRLGGELHREWLVGSSLR